VSYINNALSLKVPNYFLVTGQTAYACHRYDQAAFNAILRKENGLEFMKKLAQKSASGKYFMIVRHPTKMFTLRTNGNCRERAVNYQNYTLYRSIMTTAL